MSFPNDEDEAKEGWFKEWGYCSGYMYCAYSQVGGTHKGAPNKHIGRVFQFEKQQTAMFDYLGDIWMGIDLQGFYRDNESIGIMTCTKYDY